MLKETNGSRRVLTDKAIVNYLQSWNFKVNNRYAIYICTKSSLEKSWTLLDYK